MPGLTTTLALEARIMAAAHLTTHGRRASPSSPPPERHGLGRRAALLATAGALATTMPAAGASSPGAAAAGFLPAPCPVAAAAARAAAALAGMNAAAPGDHRTFDSYAAMLGAPQDTAASKPARSLAGALYQVLLAFDEANKWLECESSPEQEYDTIQAIRRCTASAADVLLAAGVPCDPGVFYYYRSPYIDPFAEVQA